MYDFARHLQKNRSSPTCMDDATVRGIETGTLSHHRPGGNLGLGGRRGRQGHFAAANKAALLKEGRHMILIVVWRSSSGETSTWRPGTASFLMSSALGLWMRAAVSCALDLSWKEVHTLRSPLARPSRRQHRCKRGYIAAAVRESQRRLAWPWRRLQKRRLPL